MAVVSYCKNLFYNELFCFPVTFSISTHITGKRFSLISSLTPFPVICLFYLGSCLHKLDY